jgi:hypothetical protein
LLRSAGIKTGREPETGEDGFSGLLEERWEKAMNEFTLADVVINV